METILIADDHEIVRRGVRMMIQGFSKKYHFMEAATCTAVIQALSRQPIHYSILDMNLVDGNIFSLLQEVSGYNHPTKILVYSMSAEKIYARRLIEKGVRGFVCKQASLEELERAVKSLLNGDIYMSAALKESMLGTAKGKFFENPIDLLSDRELEVTEYVSVGMGAKEIAQKMNLDITTISTYRRRAFEKLDVQNMIELKDKFLFYKMQDV